MANTLGLDDDLDGVEVVESIERAFDLKFANAEVERILTVGEMYDLLASKIPDNASDRKCATAMAFYRLKTAIEGRGDERITPSTDIRFLEARGVRSSFASIEEKTGLNLPRAAMAWVGFVGLTLFVVSFFTAPALCGFFGWALLSWPLGLCALAMAVGWLLTRVDQGKLPKDCETLGGLSRETAKVSYGKLVKAGASHRGEDIWNALLDLLSCYALPRSEITRDTLFLQNQLSQPRKASV